MKLWKAAAIGLGVITCVAAVVFSGGIAAIPIIGAGVASGIAGIGPLASLATGAMPSLTNIAQSTMTNVASDALAKPVKKMMNGEEAKPDVVIMRVSESTFKHNPAFIENIGKKFEMQETLREKSAEKAHEPFVKRSLVIEVTPDTPSKPSESAPSQNAEERSNKRMRA